MSIKNIAGLTLAMAAITLIGGCGRDEFRVEGTIDGADNEKIVLEKADFSGRWQVVDSTRTDGSGHFSISHIAPENPEIYRLGAADQWVYLPVDSTETITVSGPLKDLAGSFTLTGSLGAEQLEKFEKKVHSLGSNPDATALSNFRREVYTDFLQDARGSVVSYYILTKTVDGRPLFDVADPEAVKYVAAVASSFKQFRPDDPRAALLESAAREGLRKRNASKGRATTYEAEAIGYFDMSLPDETGREVALSEVAGKGKKTLLVFTLMNHPDSPELNRRLRELVASRGVAVYQVSFDSDQYEWREGASNLPWTTVFDPEGQQSQRLVQYNVGALPTVFVIDAEGQLTTRIDDMNRLGNF